MGYKLDSGIILFVANLKDLDLDHVIGNSQNLLIGVLIGVLLTLLIYSPARIVKNAKKETRFFIFVALFYLFIGLGWFIFTMYSIYVPESEEKISDKYEEQLKLDYERIGIEGKITISEQLDIIDQRIFAIQERSNDALTALGALLTFAGFSFTIIGIMLTMNTEKNKE